MDRSKAPETTKENMSNLYLSENRIIGEYILIVDKSKTGTLYQWNDLIDYNHFKTDPEVVGIWRLTKLNGKKVLESKITGKQLMEWNINNFGKIAYKSGERLSKDFLTLKDI